MRKIQISQPIKLWLIISCVIVMLCELFYILTQFGFFLFMAIGYCVGCVVNAIYNYCDEAYRLKKREEYEAKLASEIND